ncbi:MAG: flavohemoglobin expression-modulating QEGLA motif protein [Planctomycetota bacterium]
MTQAHAERLREASLLLRAAESEVRILRTIAWDPGIRERFLASGAQSLPQPEYPRVDLTRTYAAVAAARRLVDPGGPGARWLMRAADSIETGARMLDAIGTREFHAHSSTLYGGPRSVLVDGRVTPLDLAQDLDTNLSELEVFDLGLAPAATTTAEEVALRLRAEAQAVFGAEAPLVEVVDGLASKAIAGPRRVRVRRGATFSDLDLAQLIEHELRIHVATALAGRAQAQLPLLAVGHPGITRTQEGLAVLAEVVTRATDPARMRRLAARVIGIDMAENGADFRDLYRFHLERGAREEDAFEDARRVVRGGLVSGGAPFTKDVVYLDGLLRVQNFLRVAVQLRRLDLIRLLFVGKVAIADVPDLAELRAEGFLAPARYLPTWAEDLRPLVATMAFSGFLNRVHLATVRAHYERILTGTPSGDGEGSLDQAPMPADAPADRPASDIPRA